MNKKELIGSVVEKTGLTKKDAACALNAMLEVIEDAMMAGEKVQLVGFGTFEVKVRSARNTKNPRTSEVMALPEKNVVKFKSSSSLKKLVNA